MYILKENKFCGFQVYFHMHSKYLSEVLKGGFIAEPLFVLITNIILLLSFTGCCSTFFAVVIVFTDEYFFLLISLQSTKLTVGVEIIEIVSF